MITTWTISTCEHDVATGFITVAHWQATATEIAQLKAKVG